MAACSGGPGLWCLHARKDFRLLYALLRLCVMLSMSNQLQTVYSCATAVHIREYGMGEHKAKVCMKRSEREAKTRRMFPCGNVLLLRAPYR